LRCSRATAELRHRHFARAARCLDPQTDRGTRARADETDGDRDQHLPRSGSQQGRPLRCAGLRANARRRARRDGRGAAGPRAQALHPAQHHPGAASCGPSWENWKTAFRNSFDNIERVARGEKPLWAVPELRGSGFLFDHLVGRRQRQGRYGETDRLGASQVGHRLAPFHLPALRHQRLQNVSAGIVRLAIPRRLRRSALSERTF